MQYLKKEVLSSLWHTASQKRGLALFNARPRIGFTWSSAIDLQDLERYQPSVSAFNLLINATISLMTGEIQVLFRTNLWLW